ncbi:MAG: MFS transporter [Anaerolineae bacterium]|nr:MFS transporter [Anaerolineae bacterium]
MITKLSALLFPPQYKPQIWLLFWGTLFSSTGNALIWPFLTIYIREQLDISLTTITLLFTFQSVTGFVATALVSPIMDRLGRKKPMILALITSSITMIVMSHAWALWHWALLLPLYTVQNTVFRIGSYTMIADMVKPDRRSEVYALLRMGDNVGIAAGPTLGGFLVTVSYALSFYLAGGVQIVIAVFMIRMIGETLLDAAPDAGAVLAQPGYGPLLHDQSFLMTWGLYILVQIANAMVFVLLGLYVKENFGIPENRYGFIVGANAVMVVTLQYSVTRVSDRYRALPVIALGALLYAVGMGVFGMAGGFVMFLAGMVILTLGELLLVPTATALVANIAPPDMRARYMGTFSLSFRIGAGIGPVVGGVLSDTIAPAATWYGGMVACVLAAAGFWLLRDRLNPECAASYQLVPCVDANSES